MRILITAQHRSIVGGAETYLQALIPALLRKGHEIGLLCDYAPGDPAAATIDPGEARLPVWYVEQIRQNPEQWKALAHWDPDVVYSNGLAALDIDQALLAEYPVILYAHSYWGTCATGQKCHSFPGIQICTRTFGPACLLLHYPRRCGGLSPVSAWRVYQKEKARNARLPEYHSILVASTHMREEMEKHGVSADKLRLVRLPLTDVSDALSFDPKTPSGHLLFVGRLAKVKGVEFLLRAIPIAEGKLGQTLTATIAGDGSELAKLKRMAADAGIAAVFTGWVEKARRRELMRRADLLIVPSLWPEPFGLVGIEAGSLGLPAAGFASGGIPDWLIPGRTGELAPSDPATPEGLADAIVRALANPTYYAALRRGAFEFSKGYTLDRHLAELEEILYGGVSAGKAMSNA